MASPMAIHPSEISPMSPSCFPLDYMDVHLQILILRRMDATQQKLLGPMKHHRNYLEKHTFLKSCDVAFQIRLHYIEHNPMLVYSKVTPIVFTGAYSQEKSV